MGRSCRNHEENMKWLHKSGWNVSLEEETRESGKDGRII